jgi:hypothetical protein
MPTFHLDKTTTLTPEPYIAGHFTGDVVLTAGANLVAGAPRR